MKGSAMSTRYAKPEDISQISNLDKHIAKTELLSAIRQKRVLLAEINGVFAGWLRFNLFWDNTPFMNMLFVLETYRNKGVGSQLVARWETEMQTSGYSLLMTSTLASETAQFFYRKREYQDAGSLLLPNEPLEIIFIKKL